jgi:threonine dehydrogenase-like Zn-dependent dehydrogenase
MYAAMERSDAGQSMGHEAIGVVEDVGSQVTTIKKGDVVVMPFAHSDGTCAFCHEGVPTACMHVGFFGNNGTNGAQAEPLRIPFADGTLYPLPVGEDDALMPSVLTLSDLMGTGHHAAVVAKVGTGRRAAVVGDGAVGLCAVIAAKRLGARGGERVTSSPAGINVAVGGTGSAAFPVGTRVTLSAANQLDVIWSGACSSGGNKQKTCAFTLNGPASVTANVQ